MGMIHGAAALAAQLQAGAAALFPTDTVVALGAVPKRPNSCGP